MRSPLIVRSQKFAFVVALCIFGANMTGWRCGADTHQALETNSPVSKATVMGSVYSIALPHFEPDMPALPGRETFLTGCASCHSPRYITMQPTFPRRQWEETVGKMVKTYGAPIDEQQQQAIVDYLVAVNTDGATVKADPSSDDEDSISVPRVPPPVESFPLIKVSFTPDELAADLKRGADLFALDCVGCHGKEGRGDGFVGPVLSRRPANLAATRFSMRLLSQVLWNGMRGTSMPSWRSLPPGDLRALAEYAQTLHQRAKSDEIPSEPSARARSIFQATCAPCHGPAGDGMSAVGQTLNPPPASLKRLQPDTDLILQVLRDGITGTALPSWREQLSESDRSALASLVRSFYEPDESSGK